MTKDNISPLATVLNKAWLLGPFPETGLSFWKPPTFEGLSKIDWSLVKQQGYGIGTILLLSSVSVLLTVNALELMNGYDIDMNRELRISGFANLISASLGGMVGFHSLSISSLAVKSGVNSRLVGLISVLVCAFALYLGPDFVKFLPRPVLGGLLMFLGISFLWEWLVKSWEKLPKSEYFVIPIILLFIAAYGFIQGVLVGIFAALILFVINYSQSSIIRYEVSGDLQRSNVERCLLGERCLSEEGGQLYILKLQGYLFFGTVGRLLEHIRIRQGNISSPLLRYALLDFSRVTGIDSSAVHFFIKMQTLAGKHKFDLVFTGLSKEIKNHLTKGGITEYPVSRLRMFLDLDHGLEWCEDRILDLFSTFQNIPNVENALNFLKEFLPSEISNPERILAYLEKLSTEAGSILIEQDADSDALYIVDSGGVSVYWHKENGESIRLRRKSSGTVIGELGFYLNVPRTASVISDSVGVVYRLSKSSLNLMENEAPDLAIAFHRGMAALLAQRLLIGTNAIKSLQ